MSDQRAKPILSRQAFTIASISFLDADGVAYVPTTVEKRVVTATGEVLTDWTQIPGFADGGDIEVTAAEMEMQDDLALVEKHIVLIVGDRGTNSENPLRIVVPVKNRELLP